MQMQKIKKVCVAEGRADLMHTEGGDWIVCGQAMYSCDGLSLTPDMLAALWGLTAKERNLMTMQEYTPADIGLREEDVSNVSDGDDVEMVLQDSLETPAGLVRIYKGYNGNVYLRDALLTPVEKKDGVAVGLRRVQKFENERFIAVNMQGHTATRLFYANSDAGDLAKAVRRRVMKLYDLTGGVRLEEAET